MQLTYPTTMVQGFAGMLADNNPRNDILSRASEEATSFPYGVALVRGTDLETQVKLPTAAAAILGIAVHTHANEVGSDGLNKIDLDDAVNVLHEGRIYVIPEETVAVGDPVYVRIATGAGGTQKGAFRNDADTATALLASGMRWIQGGTSTTVAILEIDAGAAIA